MGNAFMYTHKGAPTSNICYQVMGAGVRGSESKR